MLLLQHILTYLETHNCRIESVKSETLGYLCLPDVIRFYTGKRKFSHFEKEFESNRYAYITFPCSLKNYDINKILSSCIEFDERDYSTILGNETSLDTFYKTNYNMLYSRFESLSTHLLQDKVFDNFIREIIDDSHKLNDRFYLNIKENSKENKLNGTQVRELILNIEEWAICNSISNLCSRDIWLEDKININSMWNYLQNIIYVSKLKLKEAYSDFDGLYENTEKFLNFDKETFYKEFNIRQIDINDACFKHCNRKETVCIKNLYIKRFMFDRRV